MAYSNEKRAEYIISLVGKIDKASIDKELKRLSDAALKEKKTLEQKLTIEERKAAEKRLKYYQSKIMQKYGLDYSEFVKNEKKKTAVAQKEETKRSSILAKQGNAFSVVARYAAAGTAIRFISQGFTDVVKSLLNVDNALAKVSAITGEAVSNLGGVRETIFQISGTFGIASSKVTEFVVEMTKLGKGTDEIKTLGRESAALAQILGTDLVDAGKLLVTTMNQFNIITEEAYVVAGTFRKVIAESPLAIDDIRTTFQYVGAAAEGAGIKLEDLGEIVTFLANRGLRASKIGTGLRNVILELAGTGDSFYDVMKRMEEQGLSLTEALDRFGKRGANVAFTLINNWSEVEQLFGKNMPTAIENAVIAAQSMDSVMVSLNKTWQQFVSLVNTGSTGVSEEDRIIQTLTPQLSKLGTSLQEYAKIVGEVYAMSDVGTPIEQIFKTALFSEDFKEFGDKLYDAANNFPNGLAGRIFEDLQEFTKMLVESKQQAFLSRQATDVIDKQLNDIVAQVVAGTRDREETINEILNASGLIDENSSIYQTLLESVQGLVGTELAKNKIKTALLDAKGTLLDLDLRTREELEVALVKVQKSIQALSEKFGANEGGAGDYVKQRTKLEEDESILLKILCRLYEDLGIQSDDCKKLRAKKEKKQFPEIENYDADVALKVAQLKEQFQLTFSRIPTAKEIEDLLTDMIEGVDELSLKDYTKDEIIGFLDAATGEVLDQLDEAYVKRINEIINFYENIISLYRQDIARIQVDIDTLLDPEDPQYEDKVKKAEDKIKKLLATIAKLRTQLDKDLDKESDAYDKSKKGVQDERDDMFAKLFGDPDDWQKDFVKIARIVNDGLRKIADIYNQYQDELLNQRLDMLDAELEAFTQKTQEEQSILDSSLAEGVVSQETFNDEKERLRKQQIDKENEIGRKEFEAQKERDKQKLTIDTIIKSSEAFVLGMSSYPMPAGAIIGAASAALVVASGAIAMNALNKRQFIPKKYAEGGLVEGRSHAQGGVPFTVQGEGGYEMEGGEYIFDKDTTKRYLPMFEAIRGNKPYDAKHFATGGQVSSGDSIDMKRLLDKPIRAYIVDKDLERNEKTRQTKKERTTVWS